MNIDDNLYSLQIQNKKRYLRLPNIYGKGIQVALLVVPTILWLHLLQRDKNTKKRVTDQINRLKYKWLIYTYKVKLLLYPKPMLESSEVYAATAQMLANSNIKDQILA